MPSRCPSRRRPRGWLVLAAAAAAAGAAVAQGPPPGALVESVDVEVVEVQVFVTDGEGNPAHGLTPADFRLHVDGEERPILNFFAAGDGAAAATPGGPTLPAGASPAAPAAARPPEQRLSLVVLLDELHLDPRQRGRTLARLEPLLRERLAAGDALLVASFDRSLRVLRSFDSTDDLGASLAGLRKRAPGGLQAELERRRSISTIRDLAAGFGCQAMPQMQAVADGWSSSLEHEARLTLEALRDVVASLAGREGRKALLLVSSGLPLDPGLEPRLLLEDLCGGDPAGAQTGLATEVAAVVRAANAARVTMYSLDAGGQRALVSAADSGGAGNPAHTFQLRGNLQDPAFALALDTGGRALTESNRPELLLADLVRDFSSYYSLGFAPRPQDTGRPHRIQVEVRRPGLRARHRSSWQPLGADELIQSRLLGELRLGAAADGAGNPLGASLEVDPPTAAAGGGWTTRLRLSVPSAGLALLPEGERRRGRLRIFVAASDAAGRLTPVRTLPLPVDLPLSGDRLPPVVIELRLAAGENTLAIALRDEISGQTSVLQRRVRAGSAR